MLRAEVKMKLNKQTGSSIVDVDPFWHWTISVESSLHWLFIQTLQPVASSKQYGAKAVINLKWKDKLQFHSIIKFVKHVFLEYISDDLFQGEFSYEWLTYP